MSVYKLTSQGTIVRVADGAFIPVSDENRDYQEYKTWVADGNVATPDPRPSLISSVTPLQAIQALDKAGKLNAVEQVVAQSDKVTQYAWSRATSFDRSSEFVQQLVTVLGWTEADLDELFASAATFI